MWRGLALLFFASPVFALSEVLTSILSELIPSVLPIAGAVFAAHVAMAGIKFLMVNFVQTEEVGDIASFEKFSVVAPSNTDWSAMSTTIFRPKHQRAAN